MLAIPNTFWQLAVRLKCAKKPKNLEYQSERTQHWQPLHVCKTQLHQTEGDNKSVKNVPAFLEIIVGIHGYELQKHFCRENASEHLKERASKRTYLYHPFQYHMPKNQKPAWASLLLDINTWVAHEHPTLIQDHLFSVWRKFSVPVFPSQSPEPLSSYCVARG